MQMEIVYRARAQDTYSSSPDTIHKSAAGRAEVVGHHLARADGMRLAECGQLLSTADVGKMCIKDRKIRGEHGSCDLRAVGGVADEGVE